MDERENLNQPPATEAPSSLPEGTAPKEENQTPPKEDPAPQLNIMRNIYDRVNLSVKQLDMIILGAIVIIFLIIIFGGR